ncbi:hypothetical protein D5S18_02600 [Nocardia panacis]|uniref:Uncharacterized protein n=1 Tax=Nocardia panacis TaxID=2340916 RepID=A0A3A4KZ60_9NOCA|nr:hypothetical protein D5S18_02600 [Nocardia panacis]
MLHEGRVVPALIVLSHDEQRERLRRDCPEAVPNAAVTGDICFDRLRASLPLRPTYRRALGLRAAQRLIVITSTWGADSLLGVDPDLPRLLAAALPADEFRIALAPHPNIAAFHSEYQFGSYLADAKRAGVLVPENVDAWRACLIAADLTIGDHGSVAFYSCALGIPLLLSTAPTHTVDPASPIAQLLNAAPRLDTAGDPATQIRRTITDHDPNRYAEITARTTSVPDRSAELLRAALYRTMGLDEPTAPAEIDTLPLPPIAFTGADAHVVQVRITDRTATLTRYPAERLRSPDAPPVPNTHLAVETRETYRRWLDFADVLLGPPGADTPTWIAETLARLPGCAVAAAPAPDGDWLVGDRDTQLGVEGPYSAGRLFASIAYCASTQGQPLSDLPGEWVIHCADETFEVSVTLCKPN